MLPPLPGFSRIFLAPPGPFSRRPKRLLGPVETEDFSDQVGLTSISFRAKGSIALGKGPQREPTTRTSSTTIGRGVQWAQVRRLPPSS